EWGLSREGFHRLSHLTQHPFSRGALQLTAEPFSFGGAEKGRHLGQPGRSVLAEQRGKAFVPRRTTQPLQRLQDRQVGFAYPIVSNTLPTRRPDARPHRGTGEKIFNHRRLADPWFAGHEDHLSLTAPGLL